MDAVLEPAYTSLFPGTQGPARPWAQGSYLVLYVSFLRLRFEITTNAETFERLPVRGASYCFVTKTSEKVTL
jgi:hypothetical protein